MYEVLKGRLSFAVDATHLRNRGNHRLLFEVVNRGRILALRKRLTIVGEPLTEDGKSLKPRAWL
jgi:hypothetical protein